MESKLMDTARRGVAGASYAYPHLVHGSKPNRPSLSIQHHRGHALLTKGTSQRVAEAETPQQDAQPSTSAHQSRIAQLAASKNGVRRVLEAQKSLASYMALPASQYSVLDARKIERVDDATFRCYVGELRMFQWSAEPVLTVSVTTEPGGCTIRLLSCKLRGSRLVEDINDKFESSMTNVVRWRDITGSEGEEDPAAKEIVSNTTLEVSLEVPAWCSFLPTSSIQGVGSRVLQGVLDAMVPRFLAQLEQDYKLWASGDTSRKPVGEL